MENGATHTGKAMVAGFIATLILSLLMIIKANMGIMPELNIVRMLSNILGMPGNPAAGWIAHFFIGTILWGLLFSWFAPYLEGRMWWRGIEFAMGAWVLMMIIVMPMAGAGFFGVNFGVEAPVATLIFHIIYGWVLGYTYSALIRHGYGMRDGKTMAHLHRH